MLRTQFEVAHQRAKAGWSFEPGFPSARVAAAYLEPVVHRDPSPFVWGKVEQAAGPGAEALRHVCTAHFGWSPEQAAEKLAPVLAAQARRLTQPLISSYGIAGRRVAEIKSKRMAAAISHLARRPVVATGAARRARSSSAASASSEALAPRQDAEDAEDAEDEVEAAAQGPMQGRVSARQRTTVNYKDDSDGGNDPQEIST